VSTASRQVDAAAQEAYLQGRYYWSKGTADGLRRASEYFREAARVDPLFARAFAGQADTYIMLPTPLSAFTAYPLARTAAEKAISLDPNLPEAHTSLALVAFLFEHDPVGAEAGFRRAIAAGPNYATAHQWYADVLSATGRTDEALAQLRQAKALDPLSASIQASIGTAMYLDRRYNEAQTELRASLELDSGNPVTYWYLANALDLAGSRREAEMEARRGLEIAPQNAYLLSELGRLAALNGQDAEARRIAADLAARSAAVPMPLETIAVVYAALGDRDRAFEFMRRADQERSPGVMWAKRDPMLDSLRDDPRFADLLRRLRLGP
jgi:tetratricopeptide (TPR) repeat protein